MCDRPSRKASQNLNPMTRNFDCQRLDARKTCFTKPIGAWQVLVQFGRSGRVSVAQAIEQRPAPLVDTNEAAPADLQRGDPLDRLAWLSAWIRPYSSNALAIALICLGAATALRFLGSWTNSDFLFATYFPAILAAGLVAGIPAAIGVTIVSAVSVRLFFV